MGDAEDLLIDGYQRVADSVPTVLDGLDTDDLSWRALGASNSIGWLVWHLTRVLDGHLADAFDREEVLTAQGYADRLDLGRPAAGTGYGDSSADVDATRVANPEVLADYHRACQDAAAALIADAGDLTRVVDPGWDPPVTLGARLMSVLDDLARHVGQAELLRGLLDHR